MDQQHYALISIHTDIPRFYRLPTDHPEIDDIKGLDFGDGEWTENRAAVLVKLLNERFSEGGIEHVGTLKSIDFHIDFIVNIVWGI